ncbi:Mitochondrial tRNAs modification protein [Sporothrix epigloea]|uniref:N(6)-L-threonylcarbamoyladenine synthase n=1 Tax=Sporothrix epigloea TaxID=1892477 RepID=A0ABP0E083_9PEZI
MAAILPQMPGRIAMHFGSTVRLQECWFEGGASSHAMDTTVDQRRSPDRLVTLAIETSCDDTCVAILEKDVAAPTSGKRTSARLLFEERITADNRAFGGIHPLAAAESHMAALAPLLQRATACLSAQALAKPDFVSVTRGPGMTSSLATGLAMAKGLAVAWNVPLVGVHHMQAHALTPRLVDAMEALGGAAVSTAADSSPSALVEFPYLSLLVSGGHTMLVYSRALTDHRILATTTNIAIGDLLDKCARAILPPQYIAAAEAAAGRSLPYGALLERFAFGGDGASEYADYAYPALRRDEMAPFDGPGWQLVAPLSKDALRNALRFDFSGLNGNVLKLLGSYSSSGEEAVDTEIQEKGRGVNMADDERRLLARGTMQQAFEHLASRLLLALKRTDLASADADMKGSERVKMPTCLVVSGGVASNRFLRHVLRSALHVHGYSHLPVVAPPPSLCTDNAAMIAWAGLEMYEAGWQSDLRIRPIRRWSMDANAPDGGILGPPGWLRRENL